MTVDDSPLSALLRSDVPLLLPVAHDAFSMRMIERAGFSAAAVGGFGIIGCRLGLPDLGLASFGEISAAVREINDATNLPIIVDADDGYGDVKNVTRTVLAYQRMGVAAIVLEDQVSPKKCGHMAVKREIVPIDEAARKLSAALAARVSGGPAIIARTDARSVEGLDAALERGRRYVSAGAHALFIEAPVSLEELQVIGGSFDVPLVVNAAEGGRTPLLSPSEYRDLGFSIILYPGTLLLRMAGLFERVLSDLRNGRFSAGTLPSFETLIDIVGTADWMRVDSRFGGAS